MSERVNELDSVRGLAALSVAFAHSTAVFAISGNVRYWETQLSDADMWVAAFRLLAAFAGVHAAVILFFVLSGFVLTKSLTRNPASILFYPARRLARLMPTLIVSTVVCWLVVNFIFLPPDQNNSIWFHGIYGIKFSYYDLLGNIFLQNSKVNNVTWTISTELIWSSLLPILLLTVRFAKIEWIIAALLIMTFFGRPQFAQYGFCFALGSFLAMRPNYALPGWFPVWALSVIWIIPFIDLGPYRNIILIISCGAIIYWTDQKRPAFLKNKEIVSLGLISYSFYLIHPAALYITATALRQLNFFGVPGNIFCFLFSSILAYLFSIYVYKYVELPSIKLSRSIGGFR